MIVLSSLSLHVCMYITVLSCPLLATYVLKHLFFFAVSSFLQLHVCKSGELAKKKKNLLSPSRDSTDKAIFILFAKG